MFSPTIDYVFNYLTGIHSLNFQVGVTVHPSVLCIYVYVHPINYTITFVRL